MKNERKESVRGMQDRAVSLNAVIEAIDVWDSYAKTIERIKQLPSVQPKTGYWRAVYQGDEIINYRCSKCEFGNTFGRSVYRMNFCPNCGADMREDGDND